MTMDSWPDFSKPGSDGTLPDTFLPWRWIAAYTVRPELLSTLDQGKEYRIIVSVLGKGTNFAELYERATSLANSRADQRGWPVGTVLHKRILTQGWWRNEKFGVARAFVTLGITCLTDNDVKPEGERPPTTEELALPGGATPDTVRLQGFTGKDFHEACSEADVRDDSDTTGIFTVSYGEYVESCEEIDYEAIVRRAEQIAARSGRIVRREWFCATSPNIAVVHVYVSS